MMSFQLHVPEAIDFNAVMVARHDLRASSRARNYFFKTTPTSKAKEVSDLVPVYRLPSLRRWMKWLTAVTSFAVALMLGCIIGRTDWHLVKQATGFAARTEPSAQVPPGPAMPQPAATTLQPGLGPLPISVLDFNDPQATGMLKGKPHSESTSDSGVDVQLEEAPVTTPPSDDDVDLDQLGTSDHESPTNAAIAAISCIQEGNLS